MLTTMRTGSKRRSRPPQTEIGRRIERARLAAGLKQAELARLLGVDNVQIWKWEKDGVEPTTTSLARIAKACGVSLDSLAGDALEPKSAAS
jgi:transcriptional regulator with XRE-family HTH domain